MNLQRNTIARVMPVLLTVTLAAPTFAKAPAGKQAPQAPPASGSPAPSRDIAASCRSA